MVDVCDGKIKVSVVMPFYNAGATIARAIQSILDQTYSNFELILVDNNSTDNSIGIAREFAEKDRRIVLLHEPRQGVTYAANTGNNAARGEYIARMDADDVSLPKRLCKQVLFLDEHPPVGVVSCFVEHVGHHKSTVGIEKYVNWANSLDTPEKISLNRFVEMPLINPTVMFRRELLQQHGGYIHGDFPEDYEMWLRWMGRGVKLAKVPEVLFRWYDSDTRLTRSDVRYSTDAFYRTKAGHLADWLMMNDHPYIWVWGAGRKTRKRVKYLMEKGIFVEGYIDVKPRFLEDTCCIYYEEFNWEAPAFILSFVGNHGARDKIRNYLLLKGKVEGRDFLMMA
jgi:glycosyltransferase involved in cell wall biosynthesis